MYHKGAKMELYYSSIQLVGFANKKGGGVRKSQKLCEGHVRKPPNRL